MLVSKRLLSAGSFKHNRMSKEDCLPVQSALSHLTPLRGKDYRTLINLTPARIAAIDFTPPLQISASESEFIEALWAAPSVCTEASLALAKAKKLHDARQVIGLTLSEVFPRIPLHDTVFRAWFKSRFELACHEVAYPEMDHGVFVEFSLYGEITDNFLQRLWIVGTDVSEQRLAWKRLIETEQHYRTLVERPGIILKRIGPDGSLHYVSPDIVELTGYSPGELHKNPALFGQLLHPDDRSKHQRTMAACRDQQQLPLEIEYRLRHHDGSYHWCYERITTRIALDGSIDFHESIILDIQEKKQLELELAHAQRMETVGALASGIAHDFNNYLAAIIGQLNLTLSETESDNPAYQRLAAAEQAALRCADMASQLLSFGKKSQPEKKVLHSDSLLEETLQLIKHVIPASIEATLELDGTLCPIEGNSTQLQQVLMNLAVNSRDAMPEGGFFTISARTGMSRLPQNSEASRCLMITVKDSGPGIPARHQPHIFDPFFTTRKEDEGTGLGLSTAYNIIKSHGGIIQLDTRTKGGCCFTIMLPASEQEAMEQSQPAISANTGDSLRGDETILVADDDPMVLSMVKSALTGHGYDVITASDGKMALEHFYHYRNMLDLALIDHTMPGYSGRQVMMMIARESPNFPVIITSGYRESDLDFSGNEAPAGFLSKPYAVDDLLQTVRSLLDESLLPRLANG